MAGSGSGWAWSDDVLRKDQFLAEHKDWSIRFVRTMDYYEAIREEPSGETTITDKRLGLLMDRVEAATATSETEADEKPSIS